MSVAAITNMSTHHRSLGSRARYDGDTPRVRVGGPAGDFEGFTDTGKDAEEMNVKDELEKVGTPLSVEQVLSQ